MSATAKVFYKGTCARCKRASFALRKIHKRVAYRATAYEMEAQWWCSACIQAQRGSWKYAAGRGGKK